MKEHVSIHQIDAALRHIRNSNGESSSAVRIGLLKALLTECPVFAPALLELGRLLQVSDDFAECGTLPLAEAERLLEQAVVASDRSARMLVEVAYFKYSIRDDLGEAISLFEESIRESLRLFEEASVGMASAFMDKDEFERAIEVVKRALALVPNSRRLVDALEDAQHRKGS